MHTCCGWELSWGCSTSFRWCLAPAAVQFYRQNGIEWPTVTVEYRDVNVSMDVSMRLVAEPGLTSRRGRTFLWLVVQAHTCVPLFVAHDDLNVVQHLHAVMTCTCHTLPLTTAARQRRPACTPHSRASVHWCRAVVSHAGAGGVCRSADCGQCAASSSQGDQGRAHLAGMSLAVVVNIALLFMLAYQQQQHIRLWMSLSP